MVQYVFDTEPLIAYLYAEPGHEAVAERLARLEADGTTGAVAEVNATELLSLIARIEGEDGTATAASLRVADRDVRALTRQYVQTRRADWHLAGEIKADGDISLGDAHAVALAHDLDATLVVGADDDFDSLPVDVQVDRFREQSV